MLIRAFSVALLITLFSGMAYAQGPILSGGKSSNSPTGGTYGGAYYNFGGLSGCDFLISVWGFVNHPGRYNVPCETNLLDLLSYCGGPKEGAYLDKIRIVRRGGVDKQNEIAEVFDIDVEKYLEIRDTPDAAKDLLLFPRDLIIIDGEARETVDYILRIAQVVVALTSIVTATVAVINITNKD